MRLPFVLFCLCAAVASACAQSPTPDPFALTLPSGKVVHFETAEAKAKFLAARERQRQAQTAQVTPTPYPPAKMGQTSLDQPASNANYGATQITGRTSPPAATTTFTHDAAHGQMPSMTVAALQTSAFSLKDVPVEINRIDRIEPQEIAPDRYELTIWAKDGTAVWLIAHATRAETIAAMKSQSLIVVVQKPSRSGSEVILLGNTVSQVGLSDKIVPQWR